MLAFTSSFLGAGLRVDQLKQSPCVMCATSALPAGWVRRASLFSGRAVRADVVEWSVPETKEEASCELESLAWEADSAIQVARETMPFAMLQGRVKVMPKARGGTLAKILKGYIDSNSNLPTILSGKVCEDNDPRFESSSIIVSFADDIPRLRNLTADASTKPVFLARDLIVLPYQVFSVRVKGGDAIILQAAVWPMKDIVYQSKIVLMLGMACIVELHTHAQVEEFLQAKPTVSAVLLCARHKNTLQGNAESFNKLYMQFKEQLRALDVPLIAEADSDQSHGEAATDCSFANAVLCDMPPLRR